MIDETLIHVIMNRKLALFGNIRRMDYNRKMECYVWNVRWNRKKRKICKGMARRHKKNGVIWMCIYCFGWHKTEKDGDK
jgi:hypothetical protein